MEILRARNLGVHLSGRRIFQGVDLSVNQGEFLGLLGPNGAGKTTLLRAILGLVPSTGTVSIAGETQLKKMRQLTGYVPQRHEFAWDFPISIRDCVINGRIGINGVLIKKRAADRAACDQALKRVGLDGLADRPIGQLSGGQRQRVLVARALSTHPRLLLLDEPFTGLDMPTAEGLTQLFVELAQQGISIVMCTHDLGEALNSCSRLVLFRGAIRADGSPRELSDPHVWMDTFQVGETSPLLTLVGAHIQ
ncbi:anchored repeat-type ABC transporter ATP-binding subunit [Corynebacterium sp. ES2794-CONJ1]|uniref:anchored repeat-type ABC transporter ATP-binding subunit n=1 Tax=unclassified Corynebacterium TaxID=2624378 RepID=UPI0021690FC1|nr:MULTISPECIES: anchored repeat-type ABC transporter ATP-binding subunit [unclassified Corynebacterium]MCS4489970.1 anchored repeat-type ABC transporter ATP-binding subunit [Corynebacterium sp. ES2775-CONJ]MCS4491667.1 anchored repeat-type ABC transporter ATP-binding subunit [Corynebacterium sp. ES2715-CONJ3]MCS4531772.1 anchored repeat-type ABC transporter ATP-binding subunit [Corynebacterium sp. ES2730-CONJ]MCU9519168.1 anchored repeat-type ABC transporter ATP-binding subunit [Corynebacteriu